MKLKPLTLLLTLTTAATAAEPNTSADHFELTIRPLLATKCYSCHTDTKSGGLQLDTREHILAGGNSGPAIKPGLQPSPEAVDAFLADKSPDAFAHVVDTLLASPRYGERWGRFWLDIARYSDDKLNSTQDEPYPNSFRYRDWVIAAFNSDMPYD